jgi:hypothetical protein
VRMVVRCNVTYQHMKPHDARQNVIAQLADNEGESPSCSEDIQADVDGGMTKCEL